MSYRTLVELNHDFCPKDSVTASWGEAFQRYMRAGDKDQLPSGVTFIEMHHHSEPSSVESLQQQLDAANQRIKELEDNAKTPAITRVDIDIATRHLKRQLEAAERNLATATKALEFYKNERNWKVRKWGAVESPSKVKEDRGEIARQALAQIEQPREQFDIRDGKNRYRPCPNCKSEFGMGLVTKNDMLAVQCMECDFRGPEVQNNCDPDSDKAAFDAWNALAQVSKDLAKVEVIETPLDHALAELYKDPKFLAAYRKEIKEEREKLGLPQPPSTPTIAIDPIPGETK